MVFRPSQVVYRGPHIEKLLFIDGFDCQAVSLNVKQKISFVGYYYKILALIRKKLPTLADSFRVYHGEEVKLLSASFDGFGL